MSARIYAVCLLSLTILAVPTSCRRSTETGAKKSTAAGTASPPRIYVVNYPLKYFAERIAVNAAEVVFPAPPNEDPAFWKPEMETIASFQQADLILLNGAFYARWTDHATLPASRAVDTSSGFRDRRRAYKLPTFY